jgi:uncharacterized protein with HEPN domain
LLSDPNDAAFLFEMHRIVREIAERVEGETKEDFLADQHKPDALAMSFLALGEAANRTSRGTWKMHPHIEWQQIASLRHLIAHEYRKIDYGELWRIAIEDVPALGQALPEPPRPEDIF